MNKVQKSAKAKSNQSNKFVPDDAIFESPSGYFKPQVGANKVRFITNPIYGWLAWDGEEGDRTPVRTQLDDEPNKKDYAKDNQPKKFMAAVIIDREDGQVKIWELTQRSIIKAIVALAGNLDWGKPFSYDINITKTGEALKTKYAVTPSPKKPLEKSLIAAAQEKPCNLDALYAGENPWEEEQDEYTEYQFK